MKTEIINEIQFHAESLQEGVIGLDDFRQAVDEILDHLLDDLRLQKTLVRELRKLKNK